MNARVLHEQGKANAHIKFIIAVCGSVFRKQSTHFGKQKDSPGAITVHSGFVHNIVKTLIGSHGNRYMCEVCISFCSFVLYYWRECNFVSYPAAEMDYITAMLINRFFFGVRDNIMKSSWPIRQITTSDRKWYNIRFTRYSIVAIWDGSPFQCRCCRIVVTDHTNRRVLDCNDITQTMQAQDMVT